MIAAQQQSGQPHLTGHRRHRDVVLAGDSGEVRRAHRPCTEQRRGAEPEQGAEQGGGRTDAHAMGEVEQDEHDRGAADQADGEGILAGQQRGDHEPQQHEEAQGESRQAPRVRADAPRR